MQTEDERAWSGTFGDEYHKRNNKPEIQAARAPFWQSIHTFLGENSLEVGAGTRLNPSTVGVDINLTGYADIQATATALPFRDKSFNLVFTAGLLIHIPDMILGMVVSELHRVSRKWILAIEYEGNETIPYRGQHIYKRDYGEVIGGWKLCTPQGWDRATAWLAHV